MEDINGVPLKVRERAVRVVIFLKKDQYDKLVELCYKRGYLSVGEAIRAIIGEYLGGERK